MSRGSLKRDSENCDEKPARTANSQEGDESGALSILSLRQILADNTRVCVFALTHDGNDAPAFRGPSILPLPVIRKKLIHVVIASTRDFLAVAVDLSRDFMLVHASVSMSSAGVQITGHSHQNARHPTDGSRARRTEFRFAESKSIDANQKETSLGLLQ
jgi:hypothetical protein